jgi:hypothetical protein
MKALTVIQPWATLLAIGAKRIETRSWKTNYRGPLAIHAAARFPKSVLELCLHPEFAMALSGQSIETGRVLAIGELVDCVDTAALVARGLSDREQLFGDFSAGRYGWVIAGVQVLSPPAPVAGSLGLWDWAPEAAVR